MSPCKYHQPFKGILDRDLSLASAHEIIEQYSSYLEELCNFASNVLARCEKSLRGVRGTPAALIHLYYLAIRAADGIQVLCAHACFQAATPLLRSLFEAALSIEYMLEDDFAVRSTAWQAMTHMDQMVDLEAIDQARKSMERTGDNISAHPRILLPEPYVVQDRLERIRAMLGKPKYKEVKPLMLTKKGKQERWWFSVGNGPKNLRKLAVHLGRQQDYQFLYRPFSKVSHAVDAGSAMEFVNGKIVFAQVRTAKIGETVHLLTQYYLTKITLLIAGKLRHDEVDRLKGQLAELRRRHALPVLPD